MEAFLIWLVYWLVCVVLGGAALLLKLDLLAKIFGFFENLGYAVLLVVLLTLFVRYAVG